jgi:hypothetical protein
VLDDEPIEDGDMMMVKVEDLNGEVYHVTTYPNTIRKMLRASVNGQDEFFLCKFNAEGKANFMPYK